MRARPRRGRNAIIVLSELFSFARAFSPDAAWFLQTRRRDGKVSARVLMPEETQSATLRGGVWATPIGEKCADAPNKYHPLYVAAMLQCGLFEVDAGGVAAFSVPALVFTSDEFTRRSMTLNGMRMSTEFFQTGSERVLELLRNRLQLGQRDIIADVLVYQYRRVLDVRSEMREARVLRAESVAAFLGLSQPRVETLLLSPRLNAKRLTAQLENGQAGEIKRALNLRALVDNQLRLLKPELLKLQARERTARHLLRESARLLASKGEPRA